MLELTKTNKQPNDKVSIIETFYSLQGEGPYSGYPTFFIRVNGCYMCCPWCDTKYASRSYFSSQYYVNGTQLEILDTIKYLESAIKDYKNKIKQIVFTGGEPLADTILLYIGLIAGSLYMRLDRKVPIRFESSLILSKEDAFLKSNVYQTYKRILLKLSSYHSVKDPAELGMTNQFIVCSPKLSRSCYPTYKHITEEDILRYYTGFTSSLESEEFFSRVCYKFVYLKESRDLLFRIVENLSKLNALDSVYLMPFTPNEFFDGKNIELKTDLSKVPLKVREEYQKNKEETAKVCLELGVKYTDRLHIDLNLR